MPYTWISDALQASLKLVGWSSKTASDAPNKAVGEAMQQELYDFKSFADQTNKLVTFRSDFLLPLMEGLQRGQESPAASKDRIARFIRRAQELGIQCTDPTLEKAVELMRVVGEKDFSLYTTYQHLNRIKLAIEETESTMNERMRELRLAYPRRPATRR